MQIEIKEIVCEFEKIFPPSFFDIMERLPVHLVDEIRMGGPIHLRWMYSSERKMCKFKGLVRNRRYPEGCIAKGFDVEEFLIFGSRYLHYGVKTPFSRYRTEYDEVFEKEGDDLSLFFLSLGIQLEMERLLPWI